MAGINPIDSFVVSGALPKLNPIPHIPGAESAGIVEQVGSHIKGSIKKGDKVVIQFSNIY
jgi:NADPH:quinone reductase-like Zn-dependent oxidoreductase